MAHIYVILAPWQYNAASCDTDIVYKNKTFTSDQFADGASSPAPLTELAATISTLRSISSTKPSRRLSFKTGFLQQAERIFAAMVFAQRSWGVVPERAAWIDPVIYFKMLMIGSFENRRSERAIAARCEDSLSVRAFLGYGLDESTLYLSATL